MCSRVDGERTVVVEGVGKCYEIYAHPRHRLLQTLCRGRRKFYREFWALRDVSFTVSRGDCIGIIGQNGAGKSTLLQILAGTLSPTFGEARVQGRVAALLELGSGFNPEFTGRENVYLNGAILGLPRQDIDQQFGAIAEFAEIGEFMDQPVKSYSSGMRMRLAFAVYAQISPDVLIVDEALSVGDEKFRRKCFAKLESLMGEGCTVLFVTHSTSLVERICNRAILLEKGKLLAGPDEPKFVVDRYHELLYGSPGDRAGPPEDSEDVPAPTDQGEINAFALDRLQLPPLENTAMDETAQIEHAWVRQAGADKPSQAFRTGDRVEIGMIVRANRLAEHIQAGIKIRTVEGVVAFATSTLYCNHSLDNVPAGRRCLLRTEIDLHLGSGTYFVSLAIADQTSTGQMRYYDKKSDLLMMKVDQPTSLGVGIAALPYQMTFDVMGA